MSDSSLQGRELSASSERARVFSPLSGSFGTLGLGADEWQDIALKRLRYTCYVAIGLGTVGFVLSSLAQLNLGVRAGSERPTWLILVWIAASCVELFIVTRKRLPALLRLDTGLVFLVLTITAVGFFRHWLPYAETDVVRGPSGVALVLLFFAVVVPVRPKRMAVAAALSALSDPLTLWITTLMGNPVPPWNIWLWLCVPSAGGAVIAVLTSRFLFDLGKKVAEAKEVGTYKLVERLGAGGMGEVWLAEHHTLARPVALKLVKAQTLGAADDEAVRATLRRFEREAQATAKLTSVHTIEVYDFGTATDGTFFYVMEHLDGRDLDTILQRHGALPVGRVVHLLLQASHSLRDAHDHGVIHRDIKPANIFVCRRGAERDFVKVLDFGLVKSETDPEDQQLTREGAILGSPGYISPEVLAAEAATPAADVYAMGCVAFLALAGKPVFSRGSAMAVMVAHASEAPPRCSDVADQAVPAELDELIDRCLDKEPDARPTMADVEATVSRLAADYPWTREDAQRWWEQHADVGERVTDAAALAPTVDPDAAEGETLLLDAALAETTELSTTISSDEQ